MKTGNRPVHFFERHGLAAFPVQKTLERSEAPDRFPHEDAIAALDQEIDPIALLDLKEIPNLLWDCDLALGGDGGCGHRPPYLE
jgi:hypothetical protein